ncbi:MAG: GTP-binding protein [Thermoleophilia bacterium]
MDVDVIGGFLGSGKTTAILHLLRERAIDPRRTVLLVNEFGQVGVDGALLEPEGGVIRELPSGCICCSLKADFISQIQDIAEVLAPEHVVVEPSGVASMRDILQALTHERVRGLVDQIRTVLILDVGDYDWFTQMSPTFVDAQIGLAQLILLNKTDLADTQAIASVTADLEHRNPDAVVLPTTYGAFSWEAVLPLLPPLPSPDGPTARLEGYESFAREFAHPFSAEHLHRLFRALADGRYGDVQRAKGVFVVEDSCRRFDLASGRIHVTPWSCPGTSRLNVVGRHLDQAALEQAVREATAAARRSAPAVVDPGE